MVQRKVAEVPTTKPVTPEVDNVVVVTVAVPLSTLHTPVPIAGVLPANVVVVVLHKFWSAPAAAVVGGEDTLITTSSVEEAHGEFAIVHLKVALAPTVRPVTPEVAEVGVVSVATPAITLQVPTPVVGTLPANVAVVVLHKF